MDADRAFPIQGWVVNERCPHVISRHGLIRKWLVISAMVNLKLTPLSGCLEDKHPALHQGDVGVCLPCREVVRIQS